MAEALVVRKFKLADGSYPKLGEVVEGPEDELRHYALRGFLRITQHDPAPPLDLPPALLASPAPAPPVPAPVVEEPAGLDLPPEEAPPVAPERPELETAAVVPPENTKRPKAKKKARKTPPVEEGAPQ